MTESSSNKLLNGDACQRSSKDKKSGKNGFVKNHCLFQQPQKYRRPREKVRPSHPLLDIKPLTSEEQSVFILILSVEIDTFTSLPACFDGLWIGVNGVNIAMPWGSESSYITTVTLGRGS